MANMVFQGNIEELLIFLLEWKLTLLKKKLCRNASIGAKAFLKKATLVLLKGLNKHLFESV